MKFVSFEKYLQHAGILYNKVRYSKQAEYQKLLWEDHKCFYRVYLIGHNYTGEYEEMEERLKKVKRKAV